MIMEGEIMVMEGGMMITEDDIMMMENNIITTEDVWIMEGIHHNFCRSLVFDMKNWTCGVSNEAFIYLFLCDLSRPNPPGTISGRQLGEAAHRLVINSLQMRPDQMGYHYGQDHGRMMPPTGSYPVGAYQRPPAVEQIHSSQPYTAPASHQPYGRPNYQNQRSHVSAPRQGNYHYNRPPHHPPAGPAAPVAPQAYYQPSGYSGHQGGQSYGVGGYNQWGGRPQSQNAGRGYGNNSQQGGNRFSTFNRGQNRRPPSNNRGR